MRIRYLAKSLPTTSTYIRYLYQPFLFVMAISITSYSGIGSIRRLISTERLSFFDDISFIDFTRKFNESDLNKIYPIKEGCGQLFPPPQYLVCGRYIRKWRTYNESEQQNIRINNIPPSIDNEEITPSTPVTPPTIPPNFTSKISNKRIHELAASINLYSSVSMYTCDDLNPEGHCIKFKPPIHWIGACCSWRVILHIIRYFTTVLDDKQRLEEKEKERLISRSERRKYNKNIYHLHINRVICDGKSTPISLNETCEHCGFKLTPKLTKYDGYQNLMEGKPPGCPQCIQTYDVAVRKTVTDNKAYSILADQIIGNKKQPPALSSPSIINVDIHSSIKKNIGRIGNSPLGKAVLDQIKSKFRIKVQEIEPCFSPDVYKENQ